MDKKNLKNDDIKKEKTFEDSNLVYYGDRNEVTSVDFFDYNDFLKEDKQKQNLPGFDKKYNDFVEYIIEITHNIWEEKGIGVIYDTYHNNVTVHNATQNSVGISGVVSGTLQTLFAFPDRRLVGQEVIWSKMNKNGFLSSHRVMSTATNLGDSNFGVATGKKINFRTVIDCAVENNRIYEEWLVRDNLWILKQLGFNPHDIARNMARATPSTKTNFGISEAMDGQKMPEKYVAKEDNVAEMLLEMTSKIYNCKLINEVKNYYHKNACVHYICNEDLNGYDEIQGMLIGLISSIPTGSYEVDRVTYNKGDLENSYNVAIRWRYKGMNDGIGFFGQPSNKHIEVLGITHYKVVNNKVMEEWITFDGLDVLRQMYIGNVQEEEGVQNNE